MTAKPLIGAAKAPHPPFGHLLPVNGAKGYAARSEALFSPSGKCSEYAEPPPHRLASARHFSPLGRRGRPCAGSVIPLNLQAGKRICGTLRNPLLPAGEKVPEGRMRGPSARNLPNHPLIASHPLGTSPSWGEGGDHAQARSSVEPASRKNYAAHSGNLFSPPGRRCPKRRMRGPSAQNMTNRPLIASHPLPLLPAGKKWEITRRLGHSCPSTTVISTRSG